MGAMGAVGAMGAMGVILGITMLPWGFPGLLGPACSPPAQDGLGRGNITGGAAVRQDR